MKVNNRVLLGIALVSCLMGCLLMSDWQAIGSGDVCSLPTNLSNSSLLDYNSEFAVYDQIYSFGILVTLRNSNLMQQTPPPI